MVIKYGSNKVLSLEYFRGPLGMWYESHIPYLFLCDSPSPHLWLVCLITSMVEMMHACVHIAYLTEKEI